MKFEFDIEEIELIQESIKYRISYYNSQIRRIEYRQSEGRATGYETIERHSLKLADLENLYKTLYENTF